MMYKDEETEADMPMCGNEHFKGYCVDLAEKVAQIVNFTYEICLVKDKMYGEKLVNETWNGMIGELTREVSLSMLSKINHICLSLKSCGGGGDFVS